MAAKLVGVVGDGFICISGKKPELYSADEKREIDDPVELERLADAAIDRAPSRFIVTNDPDECCEGIGWYVERGFTHLVFHTPGHDQEHALRLFARDVLPRPRSRYADVPSSERVGS